MPEWLTRKVGPLPVWGYALVGVGIFFLYRRGKSSAASTTPSATPTSANYSATVPNYQEPSASLTTPSGFQYSGPVSGLGSLIPTGALAATSGSKYSAPTGESLVGSGYALPSGTSSVQGSTGATYAQLPDPLTQLQPLLNAGQTAYYQPTPGTFVPLPPGAGPYNYGGLIGNTPLYISQ